MENDPQKDILLRLFSKILCAHISFLSCFRVHKGNYMDALIAVSTGIRDIRLASESGGRHRR